MKRFMIGSIALACVVSGCGSSKDAGPTPVTSTMSTPSAGGSSASVYSQAPSPSASVPTPSASTSAVTSEDDVQEATKLYLSYEAAFQKWQVAGGSAVLPADVSAYLAEPVRTDVQQLLAMQKAKGWTLAQQPEPKYVVYGALPVSTHPGALVVLHTCVDSSAIPIHGDGSITRGAVVEYRAFFKRVDGALRYYDAQHRNVSTCPSQ